MNVSQYMMEIRVKLATYMYLLMGKQKLNSEEAFAALFKEAFVFFAGYCIMYDILLILVNELSDVGVGFWVSILVLPQSYLGLLLFEMRVD